SFIMVMKAMDGPTKLFGTSTVAGHSGEIDLFSYSQGESICQGCQTPAVSDFNFMTQFNASTISFKKLSLTAKKLTSVDIVYIRPGQTSFTFLKIRMENVLVTSVQESGSAGGDSTPTVAVSLAPDKIAWQRISQNADGSAGNKTTYGWDVTVNTAWTYSFP